MLEYQVVGLAVGAVAGPGLPDSLPLPEKQQEGGQHPQAVPTTPSGRRETCCLLSVAEPEPVEPQLFWDLEPEPKINFNKLFLQSVLRMLE